MKRKTQRLIDSFYSESNLRLYASNHKGYFSILFNMLRTLYRSIKWDDVVAILPAAGKIQNEKWKEKTLVISKKKKEQANSGAISKGDQTAITKDIKMIIGQFFRFVNDMEQPKKLNFSMIFNKKRLEAFIEFFELTNKVPNTIGNKSKLLAQVTCQFLNSH